MKPFSYKDLYIPKPCDENWDHMEQKEEPACRLCSKCDTPVYDFREKSTEEFLALYQQHQGKVCGIFDEDQITDDSQVLTVPKKRFRFKRIAATILAFWGINYGISATIEVDQKKPITQLRPALYAEIGTQSDHDSRLAGQLFDQNGDSLETNLLIDVYLNNVLYTQITSEDGYVSYQFAQELKDKDQVTLIINREVKKNRRYKFITPKTSIHLTRDEINGFKQKIKLKKKNILIKRRIFIGCPRFR